jgi:YD repeat-containing protein
VYVPQAEQSQFTSGHAAMLRSEFPKLVEKIRRRVQASRDEAAWIQSADYSAVFRDGQLVDGLARLNVVHTSVDSSVLQLSPCQLAVGPATWEGAETAQDAVLGNDLAGNLAALVRDSGQLQFPWTLNGTTNQWEETRFDVLLAPAPMNRLTVDLPEDYRLFTTHGVITKLEVDRSSPGASIGMQRWMVQLGGTHRFQLTVASPTAMRHRQQLVNVHQQTLYRLADDGLEVECNIELEVKRQPLALLLCRVDPQLQVTAVRLGNRDVPWSVTSIPDGPAGELQVRFAEPLSGMPRTLQVSAVGPLRTDSNWRLPRIVPQDTFWRQGTMDLVLPGTLSLRHLEPHDARQTVTETVDSNQTAVTRRFELFSSQGSLEVSVARTVYKVSGNIGTTIDIEPGTVTARVVADFSCNAGQHYLLEADVPNNWMLDSIESQPVEALADHQFVAYQAQQKRLQIRLDSPLTPETPLRLSIRAHRTQTLSLQSHDFRPLRFRNLLDSTRLVAIAPDPSHRLDLSGDAGVVREDPKSLPPQQAELVEPRSGGVVFRDNEQADTVTIKVTREDPAFTAENHVLAEIDGNALTESYRLVCRPESSSVSRLLVRLSEMRDEPVSWTIGAGGNTLLGATKQDALESTTSQYSQSGEFWELVLRYPEDEPFEIVGTRTSFFRAAQQIGLAMIPNATSQEGWLSIQSRDGSAISIKATSVKPIPLDVPGPRTRVATQARYRYDASRIAQILVDRVDAPDAQAPLWAWQCQLRTQLLQSGVLQHQAIFLLESAGGSELLFRLPANTVLTSLEVDGSRILRPAPSEADGAYQVSLPAGTRYPRVTVAYQAPKRAGWLRSQVDAHLPQVGIPVLDRRWTVWLAPGWQPAASSDGAAHNEPLTWTQRLLGPLAAPPGAAPFQIFSAQHWRSLAEPRGARQQLAAQPRLFLQMLGEQYGALKRQTGGAFTWRELWQQYQRRAAELPTAPRIWVDALGLSDSGFSLDRTVSDIQTGAPPAMAAGLLDQHQLAVVVRDDQLMITASDLLARSPDAVERTATPAVVVAREHGSLARQLATQDRWPQSAVLTLSAWLTEPEPARAPWADRPHVLCGGIEGHDWRACDVTLGQTGSGSLTVVRTQAMQTVSWILLLTAAGLISWIGSHRPRFLLPVSVATVLATMLVPGSWVPIANSLWLGSLLAGLVVVVQRSIQSLHPSRDPDAAEHAPIGVAATVGAVLFVALVAWGSRPLRGQDPKADVPTDESPKIYRVIVPVDDELKPAGDYDYLPNPFFNMLRRRAQDSGGPLRSWLARRSSYRAVFNWTRQRSSLDLVSLTAVYEFELVEPEQRIEVPWNGNDLSAEILEARLAGQPIELVWNSTRTAFFFKISNVGITQLELVLLPATNSTQGTRSLRVQIPPLSRSQLTIESPIDGPRIDVVAAAGETLAENRSGARRVELGPVDALELRWASDNQSAANARRLSVQQLSWIKVHPRAFPDSVIFDAKFRVESSGMLVNEVAFQTDPRLQYIPAADDALDFGIGEVIPPEATPDNLVVRLREPTEGTFTLRLLFRMAHSTGLGNLSIPQLEMVGARVERRALAISVAPDLDFTARVSDVLTPMDVTDFLAVWGEAESAPSLCYRMEANDPTWSFGTRALPPRSEATQQLDISVGHASMKLAFGADIDTTLGTTFQHELAVPRSYRVTDVLVTSGEELIAARAEHDGSGSLTVFLQQGVSGIHRVELLGEVDIAQLDAELDLPSVTLQDAIVSRSQLRLYRQSTVLVSLRPRPELTTASGAPTGQYRDGFGRLICALDLDNASTQEQPQWQIRVTPNQPSVRAKLVTRLHRRNDTWEAIAEYEARVTNPSDGVIDQFRLEIPTEWSEPFAIEPQMDYTVVPMPGQRSHLIVRPPRALIDQFRIRIRGDLLLAENAPIRTPDILPLDVAHVDRFYVLPTQLDQQRIEWEKSGLHLVSLKDVLPDTRLDPRDHLAYTVYARPRAVITDVQSVAGERQIGLADVQLACRPDGNCHGAITFQIEPAGAGHCTLEVPLDCTLIQAAVDGVPVSLIPLAQRRWHLRLNSEQLPQELSIVFCTQLPAPLSERPQSVRVPWITDFDVVRTLWTLRGGRRFALHGEAIAEHRVSASEQESIRLRSTSSLVESAVDTVLDSPATEIQAWYTPWVMRLASSTARLEQFRRQQQKSSWAQPDWVKTLNEQQQLIAERLGVSSALIDYQTRTSEYPQPSDKLRFGQRADGIAQRYAFLGEEPSVSIVQTSGDWSARWNRLFGALVVVLIGGVLWWGTRGSWWLNMLCQWPHAVGVVVGLAWWLFATPSLLGWVIIAVSLWGAVRLPMPSQHVRIPATDSGPDTSS